MRRVHIVIVATAPKESFAVRDAFDVVGINIMTLENRPFLIPEIASDYADGIYIGKKTG